jgi:CheY-like chemotaxis protein
VSHVTTAEAALRQADTADIVLLDHQLPDHTGVDVLRSLHDRPERPSVVMITAHGNEALAAESLRRGADDYLVKDGTLAGLLPMVLERVRRARALQRALAEAEADLMSAERRAALAEMTVTLHHEINNPLMAASAEVDLLLERPEELSSGQREALAEVRSALGRIRDIVKRIGSLREARSAAYVGDIRMIDLKENGTAGEQPLVARGAAVVYLPDEALERVVSLLLRQAGWSVRRCPTASALSAMAAGGECSLVVFASTHDAPDAGLLPKGTRPYRVVALGGDDVANRDTGADLVVRVPFDPVALGRDLASM